MVVKPINFIARSGNKLVQPAVKCRGAEYLRIIYGLEYSLPENLAFLKQRGLSKKRSLALREFALGIEALERFVVKAPLRQDATQAVESFADFMNVLLHFSITFSKEFV